MPRWTVTPQDDATVLRPSLASWRWQISAACRNGRLEAFFPADGLSSAERSQHERQAKLICFRCPVQRACLDHALRHGETFGVWGGLTPEERAHHEVARQGPDDTFSGGSCGGEFRGPGDEEVAPSGFVVVERHGGVEEGLDRRK
jgi:WhiB family transcriptional regulator, redox-sensing transcriptional regulator